MSIAILKILIKKFNYFKEKEITIMQDKYAYFFKCFSHGSRNRILRLLAANGEMSVEALAGEMQINSSTISRHLNNLKIQGVVTMRVDSPSHYYSLNKEEIKAVFDEFLSYLNVKAHIVTNSKEKADKNHEDDPDSSKKSMVGAKLK